MREPGLGVGGLPGAGGCPGGVPVGLFNPPCSLCPGRFWFRLYWFPLKVLYATCYSSLQLVPNIPFYFFFNALLLLLTLMNIYWFLVSRGSSATPTLDFSLLCCPGDGGGSGDIGVAWRGGGKPLSVPRGFLCAGIQNVSHPGDQGGDNSSWDGLALDVGVNVLASPEEGWGVTRVDVSQPWAELGGV